MPPSSIRPHSLSLIPPLIFLILFYASRLAGPCSSSNPVPLSFRLQGFFLTSLIPFSFFELCSEKRLFFPVVFFPYVAVTTVPEHVSTLCDVHGIQSGLFSFFDLNRFFSTLSTVGAPLILVKAIMTGLYTSPHEPRLGFGRRHRRRGLFGTRFVFSLAFLPFERRFVLRSKRCLDSSLFFDVGPAWSAKVFFFLFGCSGVNGIQISFISFIEIHQGPHSLELRAVALLFLFRGLTFLFR